MKINLLIALLLFQLGFSQETKMSIKNFINFSDLPVKTSETPQWADQLYNNPDLINIKTLKNELNNWIAMERKEKKEKINNETVKKSGKESEHELILIIPLESLTLLEAWSEITV